jgi:hypothetical protein
MANTAVSRWTASTSTDWPGRSSSTTKPRREDVPAAAINGSCSLSSVDLVKTVNKDGSSNLTLAEYMHYVEYAQGAPKGAEHVALHVHHFMRYV